MMTSFELFIVAADFTAKAVKFFTLAQEASEYDNSYDDWYSYYTSALRYERAAEWLRQKAEKLRQEELRDKVWEELEIKLLSA